MIGFAGKLGAAISRSKKKKPKPHTPNAARQKTVPIKKAGAGYNRSKPKPHTPKAARQKTVPIKKAGANTPRNKASIWGGKVGALASRGKIRAERNVPRIPFNHFSGMSRSRMPLSPLKHLQQHNDRRIYGYTYKDMANPYPKDDDDLNPVQKTWTGAHLTRKGIEAAARRKKDQDIKDAQRALKDAPDRRSKLAARQKLERLQANLSGADRHLSEADQNSIVTAKKYWDASADLLAQAKKTNNSKLIRQARAGMADAHRYAELIRLSQQDDNDGDGYYKGGYSGGPTGLDRLNTPIPEKFHKESPKDVENLQGLYTARDLYHRLGDDSGEKQIEDLIKSAQKPLLPGPYERGRTDAHGRPMWMGTKEEEEDETRRAMSIFPAIGKGFVGSLQSFFGAIKQAADQDAIEDKYGVADWSRTDAHGRPIHDQNSHYIFKDYAGLVDLPGHRLLQEAAEAAAYAAENSNDFERLLTSALISAGQNIPGAALSIVAPPAGLALMGMQAAGTRMDELNSRGANINEVITRGLISGGIEMATEKIPLDNLAKMLKGKGGPSFIKSLLKQSAIEGGEEAASYVANYVADKAAADPYAYWSNQDLMENVISGAMAGGIFGVGAGAVQTVKGIRSGLNDPGVPFAPPPVGAEAHETAAAPGDPKFQGPLTPGQMEEMKRAAFESAEAQPAQRPSPVLSESSVPLSPESSPSPASAQVLSEETARRRSPTPLEMAAYSTASGDNGTMPAQFSGFNSQDPSINWWDSYSTKDGMDSFVQTPQSDLQRSPAMLRDTDSQRFESPAPYEAQDAPTQDLYVQPVQDVQNPHIQPATPAQGVQQPQANRAELTHVSDRPTRPAGTKIPDPTASFGPNGKMAFKAARRGDMPLSEYYRSFSMAYNDGVSNAPRRSRNIPGLTARQYNAIWQAGRADSRASAQKEGEVASRAPIPSGGTGLVYDTYAREALDNDTANQINDIARSLDLRVEFRDEVEGGIANAQIKNGVVQIEKGNPNPVRFLLGHEITHRIQELAPEAYREFREIAMKDTKFRDEMIEEMKETYSRHGMSISNEQVMDELAADYAGHMMEDGKFLDNFLGQHKQNRTLLERIRDVFHAIAEKLKGHGKDLAKAAESKLNAALSEAVYVTGHGGESIDDQAREFSDAETKYSIRKEPPPKKTGVAYKVFLAKDGQLYPPMVANPGGEGTPVGVWLNADAAPQAAPSKTGRPQVSAGGKGTNVGKTSLAYRPGWHLGDIPQAKQFAKKNPETGVKDLFPPNFVWCECEYSMDHDYQEEAMSYGYTDKGKFRHSYAGLPKIPKDGYYRYRTNPKPDTVPWVITGAMKVNKILTDKETDAICRKAGVEPMKRLGGPIDLEKYGITPGVVGSDESAKSEDSVEPSGPVNSKKFKNWFGDWTNQKSDHSKVVDENGKPLVVYHGSGTEITEFLNEFTGHGVDQYGSGFYFTSEKSTAEGYTTKRLDGKEKPGGEDLPNVIPVYLNIRNPIVLNEWENPHLYNLDVSPEDAAKILRMSPSIMDEEDSVLGDFVESYWNEGPQEWMIDELANMYDYTIGSLGSDLFKEDEATEYREALNKVLGYDGVQINFRGGEKHFVAWFPNQIKHATENNGEFSGSDNRIKFSLKSGEGKTNFDSRRKLASEPFSGDGGVTVTEEGKGKFSLKSMSHDLQEDIMRSDLVKYGIMSESESREYVQNIQHVMDAMFPFRSFMDLNEPYRKDNRPFSAYKPNSDPLYKISLDFSTLCKKRLLTQSVIEGLQAKIGRAISAEDQLAIRDKLKEYTEQNKQLQVACALCYVEAARLKAPKQINRFLDEKKTVMIDYLAKKSKPYRDRVDAMAAKMKVDFGYEEDTPLKKLKKSESDKIHEAKRKMNSMYTPTAEEESAIARLDEIPNSTYLTSSGLTDLSINDPVIYDAFTSFVRNATKSKPLEGGIPYYYGDSKKKVSDAFILKQNAANGFRHQSWSDFEMVHLLDNITAVTELSIRGAKMHAYTKVPAFVQVNGNTGIMINLSLIPEGPTGIKDGELSFSPTEGMDFSTASDLRKKYSRTAGTIAIGVSDEQIKMMLDDQRIDYVIPYHSSGLNKGLRKMSGIQKWSDYQSFQSEKKKKGVSRPEDFPSDLWQKTPDFQDWFEYDPEMDKGLTGEEIMQRAAQNYLNVCEDRGLIPKFKTTSKGTDFTQHPNYWKLLIDRKMVDNDGDIIIQEAVRPDFDFAEIDRLIEKEGGSHDDAILSEINKRMEADWDSGAIALRRKELMSSKKAAPKKAAPKKAATKKPKAKSSAKKGAGKIQNGPIAATVNPPKGKLSIKAKDIQDAAALRAENEKLRQKAEYWKGQTKRTRRYTTDTKSLNAAARSLAKGYESSMDYKEIASHLKTLYEGMGEGLRSKNGMTYDEARDSAFQLASAIIENSVSKNEDMYTQYKDLRDYARTTRINVSNADANEIADFGSWRKKRFGKMNVGYGPSNIDQVYSEMATMWPEFFDESKTGNPIDELMEISDVLDDIYSITEFNPFAGDIENAVNAAANDIIRGFFDVQEAKPTKADKMATRYEAQIAKNKERSKRALEAARADRDKKIKDLKKKHREYRSEVSEGRKKKELKGRILRHVKELSNNLSRPSDKHHIPEKYRMSVAKLISAINQESLYTIDPNGSIRRSPNGSPTKRTQAFAELRASLDEIIKEGEMEGLVVDEELSSYLASVEELSDTPMDAMTLTQLESVWTVVSAVESSVRNANKALALEQYEAISDAANAIRKENDPKKPRKKYDSGNLVGRLDKLINVDMLTPEAFFHRLGASGEAIFGMMRRAQDKQIKIIENASQYAQEATKKVNVKKLEKEIIKVEVGGEEIEMTAAQAMSLYELMKREQAINHIYRGGFRTDGITVRGKKIQDTDPVFPNLSEGDLFESVSRALGPDLVDLADHLQKYMGGYLSDEGNAASEKVFGYKKFREKNYFPIKVDSNQVDRDPKKDAQAATIESRGFTKATNESANNALVVRSIFDVFADHAVDMAAYSAWLAPIKDIARIHNFDFWSDGRRTGTVRGVFENVFGPDGNKYMDKLMDDINAGIKASGDGNPTDVLTGNFKAAAVAGNIRVILQQPTAIFRAMSEINPAYLAAGMIKPGNWKRVKKYSPIATWKDWGYFDANTGRQIKDVLFNSASNLENIRQAGMELAGRMDSETWSRIWNAVEMETRAQSKSLTPGTEPYYQEVARRFDEVIDKTQVVDGILQRSGAMRNPDSVAKMATSFMAEPTKVYNMFRSAAYDFKHSNPGDKSKNAAKVARVSMSLVVSFAVNAVMQSIADALRDDDKEKDYWEKFVAAYTGIGGDEETPWDKIAAILDGNFGANFNPVGYIPYLKDVISIIKGYDVSRMDMEGIEKVIRAGQNMIKALSGEGKLSIPNAIANLIAETSRLLGLPLANIKRDVQGLLLTVASATGNYMLQYKLDKLLYNPSAQGQAKNFVDLLWKAYKDDPEAYAMIFNDLTDGGKNQKMVDSIKSGFEAKMKEEQGVEDVDDLKQRYYTPDQLSQYKKISSELKGTKEYKSLSDESKKKLERDIYTYITSDSKSASEMREKAKEFMDGGHSLAEFFLDKASRYRDGDGGKKEEKKEEKPEPKPEEKPESKPSDSPPELDESTPSGKLADLNPQQQEVYTKINNDLSAPFYIQMDPEKQNNLQNRIKTYATGGGDDAEKVQSYVSAGMPESYYFLYQAAKAAASHDGNNNTSQAEADDAVWMLENYLSSTGKTLTENEKSVIWHSTNKSWK